MGGQACHVTLHRGTAVWNVFNIHVRSASGLHDKRRIFAWVAEAAAAQGHRAPCVLAGDFNDLPETCEVAALAVHAGW
eukprot:26682-Alexandrium_andersonii.AAC.1